ncbi:MAG: 23S rRNA (adenine(2503)-C(2))-methyltransferase RlmN, partial [Thermodesulfobacteriota bacterium]
MNKTIDLRDLSKEELTEALAAHGEKPYRAAQVYAWLYERAVGSIDEMTDLSIELRAILKEKYTLERPELSGVVKSEDGTRKFSLSLSGGELVECVLIPADDGRFTLCVSTQTGCALGCEFCLTGSGGAGRDLRPWEMMAEVLIGAELLKDEEGEGARITNIVLMGMGEPLLNYDAVLTFIGHLIDPKGFALAPRRVTLSTAGLVPEILRLGHDAPISLAVSLNATTDEVRSRLMPINKKYPIKKLFKALAGYPTARRRY